ncbi:hypothetical protein Tco_1490944 [Tanacetum coccineum]
MGSGSYVSGDLIRNAFRRREPHIFIIHRLVIRKNSRRVNVYDVYLSGAYRDHVYAHETYLQAHQTQLQLQSTLIQTQRQVSRFLRWVEAEKVNSEVGNEKWRRLLLREMCVAFDVSTDGREKDFLSRIRE